MAKIPAMPDPSRCWFPKFRGQLWTDVVEDFDNDGKQYMEWLVGIDGPTMTEEQYEFIQNVLEEHDRGF